MTWTEFAVKLRRFPAGTHDLRPACSEGEILAVSREVGGLPVDIADMLRSFSGGELFLDAIPLVTIFGAPHASGESQLDWPSACWLTEHVRSWRRAGRTGVPFAMTLFGSVFVLEEDGYVRERGSAEKLFGAEALLLPEWMDRLLVFGPEYLSKSDS